MCWSHPLWSKSSAIIIYWTTWPGVIPGMLVCRFSWYEKFRVKSHNILQTWNFEKTGNSGIFLNSPEVTRNMFKLGPFASLNHYIYIAADPTSVDTDHAAHAEGPQCVFSESLSDDSTTLISSVPIYALYPRMVNLSVPILTTKLLNCIRSIYLTLECVHMCAYDIYRLRMAWMSSRRRWNESDDTGFKIRALAVSSTLSLGLPKIIFTSGFLWNLDTRAGDEPVECRRTVVIKYNFSTGY